MGRMILRPIGLVALILLGIFIWPIMVFAPLAVNIDDDLLAESGVLAIGMLVQVAWFAGICAAAAYYGGAL